MLKISNDKERHVIVYSEDPESDRLVVKVLQSYFKNLMVVKDQFELLAYLDDVTPKVIFLSSETIAKSLQAYYQILSENPSEEFCEHKLVCLCSRHDEERAYNACISEAVDDYIIAKPLYELHRPILVARHLLAELGIHYIQESMYQSSVSKLELSEELNELVTKGVQRKIDFKEYVIGSIERIEQVLDQAGENLGKNQTTSLNIKELKKFLATIRSNEIRPELLRIQEKALNLLDDLITPAEQLAKATMIGEHAVASRTLEARQHATSARQQLADELLNKEPRKTESKPTINRLYGKDDKSVDQLVEQARQAVAIKKKQKLTVLIIEEDHISLNLTSRLFENDRFELLTAATGQAAISYIQNKQIDLVIMDTQLPGCDCINLAEQINRREGSKPKFVMLSNNKRKEVLRRAAAAGIKMYLIKPLSKATLEKVLNKFGWS